VHRELHDRFIAAREAKPPWSTKAFPHTVREIQHHHFAGLAIFVGKFRDKCPLELTKQAVKIEEGYGVIYGRGNCQISLLEAATIVLYVFIMSTSMARLGGRVQLEQSDMCIALNIAKLAKGEFSCAVIEKTHQLFKTPCAQVREEEKQAVVFPGHEMVKPAIERHPVMICQNQTDRCLPCQNGTAKNPQSHRR
jgi:hypothetical protein